MVIRIIPKNPLELRHFPRHAEKTCFCRFGRFSCSSTSETAFLRQLAGALAAAKLNLDKRITPLCIFQHGVALKTGLVMIAEDLSSQSGSKTKLRVLRELGVRMCSGVLHFPYFATAFTFTSAPTLTLTSGSPSAASIAPSNPPPDVLSKMLPMASYTASASSPV